MLKNLTTITILILLFTFSGCGVKGRPVKAGKPLPSAPVDLTLQQKGDELLISWTIPAINQDGTPLTDLKYFSISRLAYRPGNYCDECFDSDTDMIRIYLDFPTPAIRTGNRLTLRDSNLPYNIGYRYRIIPVNSHDKAGREARGHRIILSPPPAPLNLEVDVFDRSLTLKWEMPTIKEDQGQLIGANIYRAVGGAPFAPEPLNNQPITDGQYQDYGLINDQTYRYSLRSVMQKDKLQVESSFTEPIVATPSTEF
jgi:hypothetical protein